MNEHENQTMKIFGKRLTASLLGAALVMSMPFASALTQKNITVERGVTVYVDDQKLNPGDANGNSVEPMLYNGTTYLPIRAVSAAPVSYTHLRSHETTLHLLCSLLI